MFRRTLKVWLCLLQGSANTGQTDSLQRTEKPTEDLETCSLVIFKTAFCFTVTFQIALMVSVVRNPDDALMSPASDAHAQTVNHSQYTPPEWGSLGPLPTPLFHHVRAACYFYSHTQRPSRLPFTMAEPRWHMCNPLGTRAELGHENARVTLTHEHRILLHRKTCISSPLTGHGPSYTVLLL